jgi:hypothetical protein
MANCHDLFQHFNEVIKLSDEKRSILITVRDSLRKRMKGNYVQFSIQDRMNLVLEFQSQGSFVMDTIIKPLNDDFDLDDGVYFYGQLSDKERPAPQIFHNWVIRAIDKDNDYEDIKDKNTCVRVLYKQGFHIDIPIYYAEKFESPDLAETKKGWLLSNPVEFIAWFEQKTKSGFQKEFLYESAKYLDQFDKWLSDIRKKDCQIRRLVRYMKAWGDLKKKEMPCGIILTILVAENLALNDRDDIAFRDTLSNIRNYLLSNGFKCPRPTTPAGEDLFADKTESEKQYFLNALNSLVYSANIAIETNNGSDACKEWNKHFGERFICPQVKPTIIPPLKKEPDIEALKRTAAISTPWFPRI